MVRSRIAYRLVFVFCMGAAVGCFSSVAAQAPGDGQMFLDNPTWAIGDVDRDLFVRASYAEFDVLGFSVGLGYDANALTVTSVTWDDALPFEPEFFQGTVDGGLIGYGCVFDFSFINVLAPSADQPLLRIVCDVAATQPGSTDIVHTEVPTNPERPIKSVLTDGGGQTRNPELLPGTVTIISLAPVITGFQNNSGRPGASFSILGDNFDQPDLAVTVCGSAAAAELQPDLSLLVTAPACSTVGPVEVSVCTSRGCDSDPVGFSYDPPPPVITGYQGNEGLEGTEFVIEGENFGGGNLAVTVCGNSATATLQGDGTIRAIAPACGSVGAAEVQVCTGDGCDTYPAGFTYLPPPPRITGYQNNSGRPGDMFTIEGENFDGPNLMVSVCGAQTTAVLQGDGTILATAPPCESELGEVEVCTDHGCDIGPDGFNYLPPPAPIVTGFQNNQGRSGDDFIIEGENFGEPDLTVTVCSNSALFDLLGDGSLLVTAPVCEFTGPATVVVCNVHGCDTVEGGFTYEPPPGPVIASLENNSGRPGKVFTVRGENFGEPGLQVTVCDTPALAQLEDPETLLVTAPDCDVVGQVELEICTIFGCASRAAGFTYDPPPPGPEITGFQENIGSAGDQFRILGNNLTGPNLVVSVCMADAAFESQKDGSLLVTAPPCGTLGSVAVEVCNDNGCDSEPGGFTYIEPTTPFIRADANCDGDVDIADPVYTLNHLFRANSPEPCCDAAADSNGDLTIDVSDALYTLNFFFLGGFPPPPPPYPDCGTAEGIDDCQLHPCNV